MNLESMLGAHPTPQQLDARVACLEACLECSATCTSCADACLAEEGVAHLLECIRTDLDCADVCAATAKTRGPADSDKPSYPAGTARSLCCRL